MIQQSIGMPRISGGDENYYKNFETGEHKQITKIKPPSFIKGSAVVELFDAITGKKKEEVVSENIINNAFSRYLFKMVLESISTSRSVLYARLILDYNLFGSLLLTDYTGAEDATLRRVQGALIGWASKFTTYSGADTQRGTVNQASSDIALDSDVIKFIFDWPTTAGNGTFRTLWWVPDSLNPLTPKVQFTTSITCGGGSPASGVPGCLRENVLYFMSGTTIYKSEPDITSSPYNVKTAVSVKNLSSNDSAMKGVVWDGTNFWCYGATNDKFYKYDTSFNLVTSWACAEATYVGSAYNYAAHGGKIYTFRRVDATTWNLYEFNTSGTLLNTYNLYGSYSNFTDSEAQSSRLVSDGASLFLWTMGGNGSTQYVLEFLNDGTIINSYRLSNGYGSACLGFDSQKTLWTNINSQFHRQATPFEPVAQNLLSVSTTKTSANTMKITYQFNLDISGL